MSNKLGCIDGDVGISSLVVDILHAHVDYLDNSRVSPEVVCKLFFVLNTSFLIRLQVSKLN